MSQRKELKGELVWIACVVICSLLTGSIGWQSGQAYEEDNRVGLMTPERCQQLVSQARQFERDQAKARIDHALKQAKEEE